MANRRVGKSKKVVKRRGVGVLVCTIEICLEVQGSQLGLGRMRSRAEAWSWDPGEVQGR
jgi:hypothetical protein